MRHGTAAAPAPARPTSRRRCPTGADRIRACHRLGRHAASKGRANWPPRPCCITFDHGIHESGRAAYFGKFSGTPYDRGTGARADPCLAAGDGNGHGYGNLIAGSRCDPRSRPRSIDGRERGRALSHSGWRSSSAEQGEGEPEDRDRRGAARREPLDHTLFHGPPGLGKTTLAMLMARELGVNIKTTSGPVLEKPGDLVGILTNLRRTSSSSTIHRLRPIIEVFYPAMEDFKIDIRLSDGPKARRSRCRSSVSRWSARRPVSGCSRRRCGRGSASSSG